MSRMSDDHSSPGGISARLVSFSAESAASPGGSDYDSFAEGYAAVSENNLVNAYYERPAMLALAGDVTGRRILDAGCGAGPLLAALRDRGAIVTGIDKSAGMLELARQRLGDDADLQVAELGRPLPFPDHTFEDVTASLVLHYLRDWGPALAELRRVLKPGGRLIVSVNHPLAENLWHREAGLEPDYFATYDYTVEWTAGGQTALLRFWTRPLHTMTDAFTAAGFQISVVSEPTVAPDTPRTLLPDDIADRRRFPGFLFFVLRGDQPLLLAHHGIERGPRRTRAQRIQEVAQCPLPVRELVAGITAVLGHHRQDEPPAILEQGLVGIGVLLADRCWHVGEVELDRAAAARLQVDEERAEFRAQHVARVRLSVQQLLGSAAVSDGPGQVLPPAGEELPVRVAECWRAGDVPGSVGGALGEVRHRDVDHPHTGVQPLERIRVASCRNFRRHRFVVGPQRDLESVTLVAAWRHPRLQSRYRAAGCGETQRQPGFELGKLMPGRCDPGEHVTWQQAQSEFVRVEKNARVAGRQAQPSGDRHRRSHRP
jgi:SAM-dependent methyltransferase